MLLLFLLPARELLFLWLSFNLLCDALVFINFASQIISVTLCFIKRLIDSLCWFASIVSVLFSRSLGFLGIGCDLSIIFDFSFFLQGSSSIFVFALALLTLFLSLSVSALLDQLLLVTIEILVFVKGMFAKVSHVNVNFGLIGTHVIFNLRQKVFESLNEHWAILSDEVLLLDKLLLDVQYQLSKELLVVQN